MAGGFFDLYAVKAAQAGPLEGCPMKQQGQTGGAGICNLKNCMADKDLAAILGVQTPCSIRIASGVSHGGAAEAGRFPV